MIQHDFSKWLRHQPESIREAGRLVAFDLHILEATKGRIPTLNAIIASHVAQFEAMVKADR